MNRKTHNGNIATNSRSNCNRSGLIYYVYAYLDPRKPGKYSYKDLDVSFLYEPFYIGKGKNKRCFDHLIEAKRRHTSKERKLSKLLTLFGKDIVKSYVTIVKYVTSDDQALQIEKLYIDSIGKLADKTGVLTNVAEGGKGNTSKRTKAFRENQSSVMRGARNPAAKFNSTTTLYYCDSAQSIQVTKEEYYNKTYKIPLTQEQIRDVLGGKRQSIKGIAAKPFTPKYTPPTCRSTKPKLWEKTPIYYCPMNTYIEEQRVTNAEADQHKFGAEFVSQVLHNKRKHHRRCYFSYAPFTPEQIVALSKRPVIPTKSRKGTINGRATHVRFVKDDQVVYAYGNSKQVMKDNGILTTFKIVNGVLTNTQGWQKYYEQTTAI